MGTLHVAQDLIDFFYPVGSYYETSDTNFNPNTKWGGTWVEDSKGRMTMAAGTPSQNSNSDFGSLTNDQITSWVFYTGTTYGEYQHTLSVAEMPSHNHGNRSLTGYVGRLMWDDGAAMYWNGILTRGGDSRARTWQGADGNTACWSMDINASHTHDSNGSSATHNNLPPVVVVKRWHRTA